MKAKIYKENIRENYCLDGDDYVEIFVCMEGVHIIIGPRVDMEVGEGWTRDWSILGKCDRSCLSTKGELSEIPSKLVGKIKEFLATGRKGFYVREKHSHGHIWCE